MTGTSENKFEKPISFAIKHRDIKVRMASRSGGIFTALSDEVLRSNGVVYGCALTEDFTAIHCRAEDTKTRDQMRGSKYIQSEMRDVFREVHNDLESGRVVLFSGTSCQVAGLQSILGRDYRNLLTVDIVCHGVPSPMVWKDYLKWQEEKNHSKIICVDFRNKKDYGWKAHVESLFFENGRQISSKVFATLFYGHSILRPCCYKCPYKDIIHPGNITIADYWGIDKAVPGFDDDKGVSLVLINDDKGKTAFEAASKDLNSVETRIENSMQPPLIAPYHEPVNRTEVWSNYKKLSFEREVRKYGGYGFRAEVKHKMKRIVKKILEKR